MLAALAAIAADAAAWRLAPALGSWGVLDRDRASRDRADRPRRAWNPVQADGWCRRARRRVAIDIDHIPGLLGLHFLDNGAPRPYTRSRLTVAAVLEVALAVRGQARGLALLAWAALVLHFFRDLAEPHGPGVALLWPASSHAFTIGYLWYVIPVAALAGAALTRRARTTERSASKA